MDIDLVTGPDGTPVLTLSPDYHPAVGDAAVAVRFVGNTAEIREVAQIGTVNVSPGQLLIAAKRLEGLALGLEARNAQMRSGILRADRMPPTPRSVVDRLGAP